jgi:hypothetical protein
MVGNNSLRHPLRCCEESHHLQQHAVPTTVTTPPPTLPLGSSLCFVSKPGNQRARTFPDNFPKSPGPRLASFQFFLPYPCHMSIFLQSQRLFPFFVGGGSSRATSTKLIGAVHVPVFKMLYSLFEVVREYCITGLPG